MEQFCNARVGKNPQDILGLRLARRDLDDIGGAVPTGKLDNAQPVPSGNEAQGFGIDRNGVAKAGFIRQVTLVKADGHRLAPAVARRANRDFKHGQGGSIKGG